MKFEEILEKVYFLNTLEVNTIISTQNLEEIKGEICVAKYKEAYFVNTLDYLLLFIEDGETNVKLISKRKQVQETPLRRENARRARLQLEGSKNCNHQSPQAPRASQNISSQHYPSSPHNQPFNPHSCQQPGSF